MVLIYNCRVGCPHPTVNDIGGITMENIINVEGMMCSGCENRIQNALKTMSNVSDVIASHSDGTVKVYGEVDIETVKEKIIDLGFEVIE